MLTNYQTLKVLAFYPNWDTRSHVESLNPEGFCVLGHAVDDLLHADTPEQGTMRVDRFWRNLIAWWGWLYWLAKDQKAWRN